MKAHEARELAHRKNKISKGMEELYRMIKLHAIDGHFKMEHIVSYDMGDPHELANELIKQGYIAFVTHQQTSPNDGDDTIHISWEKI